MRCVIDIETDKLINPEHIWVIVCRDIDNKTNHIFRKVTEDEAEKEKFISFSRGVSMWIGHNLIGFDRPVLQRHVSASVAADISTCQDTLVLSKLIDYSRKSHSIESYGEEFEIPKGKFIDFKQYSQEMEDYCVRDCEICDRIYSKYRRYIDNPNHRSCISTEHQFQLVVNSLHDNGFQFNVNRAVQLRDRVEKELSELDKQILEAFPKKSKLIKEVHPKVTKYGTLSRTDFRWLEDGDLSVFNGGPFSRFTYVDFNPNSHKQIISVLNEAGWSPVDKTTTHVQVERELNKLKHNKYRNEALDLRKKELSIQLDDLRKTGWKVNENNLETLPSTAPKAAKLLAKRILLESRRRTLTEWLDLVTPEGRIHGNFYGIGAWTHRMSHQNPNTANIPNEYDTAGKIKLLGKELRALWCAPRKRLLVGVDAEGIQLRIFAHYINDVEFTKELLNGDPHTLNQTIIGEACRSREAAKRFIYALLLGAGIGKLAEILGCDQKTAEDSLGRLMLRYDGFRRFKEEVIPRDATRGWFTGLDGRSVRIPGETVGQRKHLAMSGYLQNGEAVCLKLACLKFHGRLKDFDAKLVNFVHDEFQVECPNNVAIALEIAELMATSIKQAGEELNLNIPLAGSYYNKKAKDYTIATNWASTH